ncbi:MAG: VWA domain-containing protein, partial [Candidatus Paceibacterota bacterium]
SFMRARATGVRGTKNLFSLDTSKISATVVKSNLSELSPSDYELLNVHKAAVIKPFVESWKIPFRLGSAYYQLSKPEKVQGHKQICVQNKLNGKVYGGSNARRLLGLPDYEVKVEPASHPDFDLFVQSTSTNRNLVGGTKLLVMK